MFENGLPRKVFGPPKDEVTGRWRKLRNEEFHDFYSSLNIVRVMKSRRMRWTACGMHEGGEMLTGFRLQSLSERNHLEDLGMDGTEY